MIHTTRGGSSLQLFVSEERRLCDLPDRVDESVIQMLVDEIMHDKDTNILLLPDNIEAGLYRNTVRLTLNAIYNLLKGTDGTEFMMGHKFKLRHYPDTVGRTEAFDRVAKSNHVNMKVLGEVADRLLQNKNINQPLIPDALERQIYINCLKVVMRILDILQGSLQINLCGHSIGLFLGNSTPPMATPSEKSLQRASSIISKVSRKDMLRYQKQAGVVETSGGLFSFWGKQKRAMVNQVHATMFGLVLQIVQDMLDQSTIELVGVGKIIMDLVPSSAENKTNNQTSVDFQQTTWPTWRLQQPRVSRKKRMSTFVSGMGVGAVLVFLLIKQLESADGTINIGQSIRNLQNECGQSIRNLQNECCNLWTRLRSIVLAVTKRKPKNETAESDEPPMIEEPTYNPFGVKLSDASSDSIF